MGDVSEIETNSQLRKVPGMLFVWLLLIAFLVMMLWDAAYNMRLTVGEQADLHAFPDMRLDINQASSAALSLLPGIGHTMATRIVEYRTENGRFRTMDDLDLVPGIGVKTILKFEMYIVIDGYEERALSLRGIS